MTSKAIRKRSATVVVRFQNSAGQLIDSEFSEFFDAPTIRTARDHARKFCVRKGLLVAAKVRVGKHEYWNVLTQQEQARVDATYLNKQPLNWSRSQLIAFLADRGQPGSVNSVRGKPMDWLQAKAVAKGARKYTCMACGKFDTELYETGRCHTCQVEADISDELVHPPVLCECPCHLKGGRSH
jgi:hypothetical protein